MQCPTQGALNATLDAAVPTQSSGYWYWWTVTGTLTNNTGATVSIWERNIPDIYGLKADGSGNWLTYEPFGEYEVTVPSGQMRPAYVELTAGQALGFRVEALKPFAPEEFGGWTVDTMSIAADLKPVWVDSAYVSCPNPGGWR